MKLNQLLFVFIVLGLLQLSIERKRKQKKRSKAKKDPKEKRPGKVSVELFCDSCKAVLLEAMKELRGKKKESDVLDIMNDICASDKYNIYRKY